MGQLCCNAPGQFCRSAKRSGRLLQDGSRRSINSRRIQAPCSQLKAACLTEEILSLKLCPRHRPHRDRQLHHRPRSTRLPATSARHLARCSPLAKWCPRLLPPATPGFTVSSRILARCNRLRDTATVISLFHPRTRTRTCIWAQLPQSTWAIILLPTTWECPWTHFTRLPSSKHRLASACRAVSLLPRAVFIPLLDQRRTATRASCRTAPMDIRISLRQVVSLTGITIKEEARFFTICQV